MKPAIAQKPQISPKPRLGDTIEMTLPADLSSCQTWPLKNRVISTDTVKKNSEVNQYVGGANGSQPQPKQAVPNDVTNHVGGVSRQSAPNNTNSVGFGSGFGTNRTPVSMALSAIDRQVALEEKRLINALKNGDVVDEGGSSKRIGVVTPRQSPATKDISVSLQFLSIHLTLFVEMKNRTFPSQSILGYAFHYHLIIHLL